VHLYLRAGSRIIQSSQQFEWPTVAKIRYYQQWTAALRVFGFVACAIIILIVILEACCGRISRGWLQLVLLQPYSFITDPRRSLVAQSFFVPF
jgi:hypothetical protein